MRILSIGFSLEVLMTWPANKLFGEDEVRLSEYRRELAQLRSEEAIAKFRCNVLSWGAKKDTSTPTEEKVTVRVADQNGDGLVNMIAGNSALGRSVAFAMRLIGKLTDRGALKVAVSAPISIVEVGAQEILRKIVDRKRLLQYEIELLEHKLHPERRPRVSIPEDLANTADSDQSTSSDSWSPYPRR